jgi:hypothetical protein
MGRQVVAHPEEPRIDQRWGLGEEQTTVVVG